MVNAIFSLGLSKPRIPGPGFFPLIAVFVHSMEMAIVIALWDQRLSKDLKASPAIKRNVFFHSNGKLGCSFLLEYLVIILSSFLLLEFVRRARD